MCVLSVNETKKNRRCADNVRSTSGENGKRKDLLRKQRLVNPNNLDVILFVYI